MRTRIGTSVVLACLSVTSCSRDGSGEPTHKGSLGIPPQALTDPNATEFARVWAAHEAQQVSLRVGPLEDPGAWGIILRDLARNAANAYEQEKGKDRAAVLRRIKEVIDHEWNAPVDPAVGGVKK